MATDLESDYYVLLTGISWERYEKILDALDRHYLRHTYSEPALEIRRDVEGVDWNDYLKFLEALEDQKLRHIYDQGHLLMMSPLKEHEWPKRMIGRMIEAITMDRRIPIQSVSSTTILDPRVERSFQADEAYYITNERKVRGKRTFEAGVDPPPDIVIEVDVTSDSTIQLALFGRMKVPEVWMYREPELRFLHRTRTGRYKQAERSLALPFLSPSDITKFLGQQETIDENSLIVEFVKYARKLIKKHQKER